MRNGWQALLIVAAVALAGCETTGPVSRDTRGTVLGSAKWESIPPQSSRLTVRGDVSLLSGWERNQLPERYQERIALTGGSLFYERLYAGGFRETEVSTIRTYLDQQHRISVNGFSLPNYTREFRSNGKLYYGIASREREHCFTFLLEGSVRAIRHDAVANGYLCRNEQQMPKSELEKLGLDLASRIDFTDEGKLNVSRPLAEAAPSAAASNAPSASPTAAAAANPDGNPSSSAPASAPIAPPAPAAAPVAPAPAPVAAAPVPAPPTTSKQGGDVRPISVQWTSYANLLAGTIELFDGGRQGTVKMTLPDNEGLCGGTYSLSDGARGTWMMACSNGVTARGVFQPVVSGHGSTGMGIDSRGGQIRFAMERN